jgi:hypothetical protein
MAARDTDGGGGARRSADGAAEGGTGGVELERIPCGFSRPQRPTCEAHRASRTQLLNPALDRNKGLRRRPRGPFYRRAWQERS